MNKALSTQHGFSLLEIVIAITILSFIMMGVFTIVDSNIKTKEDVVKEDREYLQARAALDRFATDFSQIHSPLFYTVKFTPSNDREDAEYSQIDNPYISERFPELAQNGERVPLVENPDKSTISFFTASNRRKIEDVKQSRYCWIQYSLAAEEQDSGREGDIMVRKAIAEDPYAGDHSWENQKEQVLLRGVKSLEFKFWNSKDKRFVDGLKETPSEDQLSPRMVTAKVIWVDSTGAEREMVRTVRPLYPFFDTKKDQVAAQGETKGELSEDQDER